MSKISIHLSSVLTQKVGVVSLWVILLTLSLAVLSLSVEVPTSLELGVFVFLMLLLGIPHGATDHLVFFSQKNAQPRPASWLRFFGIYLGIMLFYTLAWYFFPVLCFVSFLLFSAYHFGQSQLYHFEIKQKKWLKPLLYLSWGNVLLLSILGFNGLETLHILSNTPFLGLMNFVVENFIYFLGVSFTVMLALLLGWGLQTPSNFFKILQELFLLCLLLFLSWSTSLLWSFAVYFALWHSLQTIEHEIRVFRIGFGQGYSWKNYIKDALPFSLISFAGIGLILLGLYVFEFNTPNLLFGFFVMISILTAPHAWLIEGIYE